MSVDTGSNAPFNVSGFCCIILGVSKSEAINLLKHIDLSERSGSS